MPSLRDTRGQRLDQQVMELLHVHQVAVVQGLARRVNASWWSVKEALHRLEMNNSVYRFRHEGRNVFLRYSHWLRDCVCDGTCLRQIVELADETSRTLWNALPEEVGLHFGNIAKRMATTLEWSPRTTQRRLQRLLQVDLAECIGKHPRDRRMNLYRRRPMHPTVEAILSERV